MIKLSKIKPNPNNPRFIRDHRFEKLKKSLREFPEMMELRPIIVNAEWVTLGGNMRLRALQELGYKEIPENWVQQAALSDQRQREFIVKDNLGFGDWDWDVLANEWDEVELTEWGLEFPGMKEEDDLTYTTKVESPIYKPKGEKPSEVDLFNLEKYKRLIERIEKSNIEEGKKELLRIAATRHIEFDYRAMAEYYAHEDAEVQELMEDSALVIIDYEKAVELGFVELFNGFDAMAEVDE